MSVSLSEGGSGVIWRCWRERITMHCVCFDVICRRKLSAIEVRGIWQRYLKCGFLMMQLRLYWSRLAILLYVNGGKSKVMSFGRNVERATLPHPSHSHSLSPQLPHSTQSLLLLVQKLEKNAAPTRNVVKCKGNNSKKKLLLPWEGVWNQLKISP